METIGRKKHEKTTTEMVIRFTKNSMTEPVPGRPKQEKLKAMKEAYIEKIGCE